MNIISPLTRLANTLEVPISTPNEDRSQIADALNRLSAAMEQLAARYDATERANRRVRIVLIVALVFLGGAMYQAIVPIADQFSALPVLATEVQGMHFYVHYGQRP